MYVASTPYPFFDPSVETGMAFTASIRVQSVAYQGVAFGVAQYESNHSYNLVIDNHCSNYSTVTYK